MRIARKKLSVLWHFFFCDWGSIHCQKILKNENNQNKNYVTSTGYLLFLFINFFSSKISLYKNEFQQTTTTEKNGVVRITTIFFLTHNNRKKYLFLFLKKKLASPLLLDFSLFQRKKKFFSKENKKTKTILSLPKITFLKTAYIFFNAFCLHANACHWLIS